MEAILETDAAGYAFIVEESSCLRHNVQPLDTFCQITTVDMSKEEAENNDSPTIVKQSGKSFLPNIDTWVNRDTKKKYYPGNPGVDQRQSIIFRQRHPMPSGSYSRENIFGKSEVMTVLPKIKKQSGYAPGGLSVVDIGSVSDNNVDANVAPPMMNEVTEQETIRFLDENPGTIIDYTTLPDTDQYADIQPSTELAEFLSRPVLINTQTVTLATAKGPLGIFRPWSDFFSDSVIKNKLQNYAYIRCKLHVKTVINSSPFYYGSVLYSYVPGDQFCSNAQLSPVFPGGISPSDNTSIVTASQLPHYWVFPQTSQGGEMVLPFFFHKTYADLTVGNGDLYNMGTFYKWLVQPFRAANGQASGSVTIQTYAWATDVLLHAPTVRAAMQSGKKDEYGTGFVSKPASAVATALGYLKDVPVIGKYALASSMVSSTVGKIASLFGYTNLPNLENVHYFKPSAAPHFASSDISVPFDKISLDPKTELSIDPTIHGLDGTDELSLKHLLGKESYLCEFDWTSSDAVDALNFAAAVTPRLYERNGTTNPPTQFETPISYFSRMFQFWRGDIIFRFRFICSPYHKGRIRLTYDPRGDITNVVPDYTSVFNQVVDIGTVQDIEIRVPYMQSVAWLNTDYQNWSNYRWATAGTATTPSAIQYSNMYNNGVITWRVVTQLTGPTATNTITCQVFVRAAENFEVAVPVALQNYSPYVTQSKIVKQSGEDNMGSLENPLHIVAGNDVAMPPRSRYLINFGENIVSLRKLLRRTGYHSTVNYYDTGNNPGKFNILSVRHNRLPELLGYDTTNGLGNYKGVITTGTSFNCNLIRNTPFTWLFPCFAASRGSINWHHVWNSQASTTSNQTPYSIPTIYKLSAGRLNINTITAGTFGLTNNVITLTNNYGNSNQYLTRYDQGVEGNSPAGQLVTTPEINKVVSFVAPNYNQYKFNWCMRANSTGNGRNIGENLDVGTTNDNYGSTARILGSVGGTSPFNVYTHIDKYFSVGADFTFMYFLCVPPMYYCDIDAVPLT